MEWCAFVTIFHGDHKTLWISHFKSHKEAERGLCEKIFAWIKQNQNVFKIADDDGRKYDLQALKILIEKTPSEFEVSAEIVKIANKKEHEFLL